MARGALPGLMPTLNSVTVPEGVIRATRSPSDSVNQTLPSGPAAIPVGALLALMPALNSLTAPAGVILPTRFPTRVGEPKVAVGTGGYR